MLETIGLLAIGLGVFLIAVVIYQAVSSDEIIIGHITPTSSGYRGNSPRECVHDFEAAGGYLGGGGVNRHHGIRCGKCDAVLWENGDITISKATSKWR